MTVIVLLGYPVVSFVYFSALLESGALPPDGDSIGIAIFGNLLATAVLSPFILGIAWLCLRNYNLDARLFAWRKDRPIRSLFGTAIFGAGTVFFFFATTLFIVESQMWFEYLWAAYFFLWVPLLLCLRAAFVEQLKRGHDKAAKSDSVSRLWNS